MENRFNLIDEPWLPVSGIGQVSLKQIFSEPKYSMLGGNPVQKIAAMKLLLAIAQAAATPRNETEWHEMGPRGLARACLAYLEKWHDRFYLYGNQPFLQMPAIVKARRQNYGAVLPEVSTGNTTVLIQSQMERQLDDADKALLLIVLMGFALGGKKTDNSVILTPGYQGKTNDKGKPSTGKPGSSVAHGGLLHNILLAETLQHSLWINLFSHEQLEASNIFAEGCGKAPWEEMPVGEDCKIARSLKQSLMGRLIPLCRFCLLADDGLHYSEGLAHLGYKEGVSDPTTAIDHSGKEAKALWANPEKRPWRELTALLSLFSQQSHQGFRCRQIDMGIDRCRDNLKTFALWSGGLRVSSNAGEQYPSGSDDFVESIVWLQSDYLGQTWFVRLQKEMTALNEVAKSLYGHIFAYYKEQLVDGRDVAPRATHLFWQLCERDFQTLVDNCDYTDACNSKRLILRRRFADYVIKAYDLYCPRETARQIDAWAKCRPNLGKYLRQED